MTGASLLADAIRAAGVRVLFNLSGNQIMPLYSPLVDAGVQMLHTRHEAAAVHMADAYARLTERPCPVLLTAGPGHANALGALYVARMAESPVVLLSGHSELGNAGLGAFQEMDQAGLARRVAKAAWVARDPARLGEDLARAYRLAASGRPGPVHVSLPADVLRASAGDARPLRPRAFAPRPNPASAGDVEALVSLVRRARNPLLVAGPAMARGTCWQAVVRLAEALGVPALPMESPRGANDPALGGVRAVFPKADLVALIGRRADFSLGFGRPPLFAPDARFVQIEPESVWRRRDLPIVLSIAADPLATVEAASRLAEAGRPPAGSRDWCEEVGGATRLGREKWPTIEHSEATPIHPLRLVAAVRALVRQGDVIVSDGGEFGQWAQAGLASLVPPPDRVINGPSGAIGAALPFAIGARLARPQARVFAFQGDGSCGYHIAEMETAVRAGLPLLLIVGNDRVWNAEVQIQRQMGGRELDCLRLGMVRYDQVSTALGGHGEMVTRSSELEAALARALATAGPSLVNVLVDNLAAPTYQAGHS